MTQDTTGTAALFYRVALVFGLVFALAPPATGEEQDSSLLSGSVLAVASRSVYPGSASTAQATESMLELRIRVKLQGEMTPGLRGELAYELAPTWVHSDLKAPMAAEYKGFTYRAHDINRTLYPGDPAPDESSYGTQNLDRAFVTYSHDYFDLYAGRQAVAFGSARAVNPTDVLAPYAFDTIARDERVGVDAIRLKVPMGAMSELDAGVVFGSEFREENSAAFLRLKGYALDTDISIIAMQFRENHLAGLDISRSIGGASAWIEAAKVFTNTTGNDYTALSVGADYAFTDKSYAYIEYHYNGAGTDDPAMYMFNLLQEAYTDAGVYLLAREYLIPGLSYQITPLVGLALEAIVNLNDDSVLASASIEYNVSEDIYLSIGGFSGFGRSNDSGQQTEFGQYPDVAYASSGYYF